MRRTMVSLAGLLALVIGMGAGVSRAGGAPPPSESAAELEVVEQGFQWLGASNESADTMVRWGVFLHNPNADTWVASGSVDVTFTGADGSVVGTESQSFSRIAPGDTQVVGSGGGYVTGEPVAMTVDLGDITWLDQARLPQGDVTASIVGEDLTPEGYRHISAAIRSTLDVDAWVRPVFALRDKSGNLLGVEESFVVVPAGAEVGAEVNLFFDFESAANVDVEADVDWDAGQLGMTEPPAGVLPIETVEVGGGWYESTVDRGASWGALIRNPNGDNWVAGSVDVTATFRDADGRIVGSDSNVSVGSLLPGQTIAIGTSLTWSPPAASIDVRAIARWAQYETVTEPAVTFADVTPVHDNGDLSAVTAVMTVPPRLVGESLYIGVIYRDASGQIIGGQSTMETAEGESTPIEITEYTHVTGLASVDLIGHYYVPALLPDTGPVAPPTDAGQFRETGTFSPEVTANIPAPTDISTDAPVMYANLILAAAAVLALTIGVRLLNTTLVAHEEALERIIRPAKALGGWFGRADKAIAGRTGRAAGAIRIAGVLLFYGVLFSFLEPGWRPWTVSGLFVLGVMTVAFGVVGTGDDLVEMRSARRWGLPARLVVKPALVLMAMGSVVLTKFAQLVPGLLIGTPEAFSMEDEVSERDETRLAIVGLGSTAAIGLGAWALSAPLDGALDGSGGFVQGLLAALVTLLVLTFAVAVENLFANMLAFPGSEGAAIRRRSRIGWWAAMLAVTALFFHTLINPAGDLADSMRSTNVRVVLITVATFLVFSVAVWAWFRRQDRHQPPAAFEPPGGSPVELPPPPAPRELVSH